MWSSCSVNFENATEFWQWWEKQRLGKCNHTMWLPKTLPCEPFRETYKSIFLKDIFYHEVSIPRRVARVVSNSPRHKRWSLWSLLGSGFWLHACGLSTELPLQLCNCLWPALHLSEAPHLAPQLYWCPDHREFQHCLLWPWVLMVEERSCTMELPPAFSLCCGGDPAYFAVKA